MIKHQEIKTHEYGEVKIKVLVDYDKQEISLIESDPTKLIVFYKDGKKDWIEPILLFQDHPDFIQVHNGYYEYRFEKKDIERFTLEKCKLPDNI